MNIRAPFTYGQISTPSENPQSSVANTITGLSGIGQSSTTYAAVETAMSSVSVPFVNPSASDASIIMANLSNYQTDKTPLYNDYYGTMVQAGIFK